MSERLSIPSRLRGFESGKVGPKDGNDFIEVIMLLHEFTSTLPKILEDNQDIDIFILLMQLIFGE